MSNNKIYDKNQIFQETIAPLMEKIKILCSMHKIPFIFAAAVENNSAGTKYEVISITPPALKIELQKDYVRGISNVLDGFATVYPEDSSESLEFFKTEETPKIFVDDNGELITGEDGEEVLSALDDKELNKLIHEKTKFDYTQFVDLSNTVNRKATTPAEPEPKEKEQTEPEDIWNYQAYDNDSMFNSFFDFDESSDTDTENQETLQGTQPEGRIIFQKKVLPQRL